MWIPRFQNPLSPAQHEIPMLPHLPYTSTPNVCGIEHLLDTSAASWTCDEWFRQCSSETLYFGGLHCSGTPPVHKPGPRNFIIPLHLRSTKSPCSYTPTNRIVLAASSKPATALLSPPPVKTLPKYAILLWYPSTCCFSNSISRP